MKQEPISCRADNALAARCQSFAARWACVLKRPIFYLAAYIDNNTKLPCSRQGDFEFQFIIIKLQQSLVQKKKKIKIVHLPFTWQLVKKRLVGVFYDSIFPFPSWKPVAAEKSKGRSRIFAVLAGPGEVASKIGKQWGVVLDSHSLHWLHSNGE